MDMKQKIIIRINNEADLQEGIAQLIDMDPSWNAVVNNLDKIPLRKRAPGFEGLVQIITAQQVSKASATAIFGRTIEAIQPFDAQTVLQLGEKPLIAAGQSRAKRSALLGLAEIVASGGLDLEALCETPVESAMKTLTSLKGIGPWTAEVFLLFCAGHADIFPSGDVALQHSLGEFLGLKSRPDAKKAAELTIKWSPLRSIVARILYADYARIKGKSAL